MKKYLYAFAFVLGASSLAFGAGKKGLIRVGTNATHPPFTLTDAKTQKIVGHDIELITKILTDLNYDIVMQDMKFDGLIPAVSTNHIDLISCALSVNPERSQRVLFTDSYYCGGSNIVVLKENTTIKSFDDLKDKTVGVEMGTIQAKIAYENAHKIGKIVEYDSEDIFNALKTGKVDATISDTAIASYFFNVSKVVDAKFTGEEMKSRCMAFAVNKNNTKLAEEVNAELAKLKESGWYQKNYAKWIGGKPKEM